MVPIISESAAAVERADSPRRIRNRSISRVFRFDDAARQARTAS
jgi:hypothetical protein